MACTCAHCLSSSMKKKLGFKSLLFFLDLLAAGCRHDFPSSLKISMHISPLLKNSLQCNQHTLFQIRKSALDKYCHPVHKPHSNFTNCPRVFLSPFLPRILSRNNKCLIPLHALQFSFVSCFPWFSRLQALYSIDASHPIYPHGQTQVMCSW